ncbi:MAG: BolA family protein [Gammaproteobacteria bacterium]|nr:BolA family protein [Gammaproteobacteria bacterium]
MSDALVAQITELLTTALKPSLLKINDDSHKHKGHAGNTGGGHFSVEISADCFKDKSRIEAHRMIYQAVDSLIQAKQIHAISIDIKP